MDTKQTTPKQQQVLESIKSWVDKHGTPPRLKDIMNDLGYSQLSSVHRHVDALRAKGLLPDTDAWTHGIKLSHDAVQEIPVVGEVPCGSPVIAEQNIEAYIPYATSKLKSKAASYFFVEATGDSMNAAKPNSIDDGDLLLVRMGPGSAGDIIIALIGDDSTCKRLKKNDDGWHVLQPESDNAAHKPRVMLENFSVTGVVEKVVKKSGVPVA